MEMVGISQKNISKFALLEFCPSYLISEKKLQAYSRRGTFMRHIFSSGPSPEPKAAVHEPPSVVKTRRLLNRWSMLGLLIVSAGAIILFVSNALAVNSLVVEIASLRKEHDKLLHRNELLRADVIRLQSADRIADIAREKLGMVQAQGAPKQLK